MLQFIIEKEASEQNIYKFVRKILPQAPDSLIQKLFRKKDIKVNGKRVGKEYIVKFGELVQIYTTKEQEDCFYKKVVIKDVSEDIKLDIIFENEDIVIINKPLGLLSQSDNTDDLSLNDIIQSRYQGKHGFTASIANRLDRNTTGLICAGKTYKGLEELGRIFRERKVNKFYMGIAEGIINRDIHEKATITRENNISEVKNSTNKNSINIETSIHPLKIINNNTLCDIQIFTGKTHQIRAHLSSLSHPLLGDVKYGGHTTGDTFYLHCYRMAFKSDCKCGIANLDITVELPIRFKKACGE